jgi:hypothetical protein
VDKLKEYFGVVVTAVAVIGYGVFVFAMFTQVSAVDPAWSRQVMLMTGVEAIAFAAIGWLFGKEVSRAQIDAGAAAQRTAQQKTDEAARADQRGRDLAEAVRVSVGDTAVINELAVAGSSGVAATKTQLDSLVHLADSMFPRR